MRFVLSESQLSPVKFQKLIDLTILEIKNYCNNSDIINRQTEIDFCNNFWKLKKIDVVRVFSEKTENNENIFDIGILIYVEDTDFFDVGELLFEVENILRNYIGKKNFKITLLNVIYK